jgi:hypothetical protein
MGGTARLAKTLSGRGVEARISKVEPNWTYEALSGGNCKGRGLSHDTSHGTTAGPRALAVQASPVESTGALVDWSVCRPTASDSCSWSEQVHIYVASSYSIGCAAAEEHSWGAGDRQSARGTLSGRRERE